MQPIFQNNSGQSANNGSGSYLSSRAVARKVLSAQVSLTSVFGMRTGGSSPPSPPLWYISRSRFVCPSLHVLPAFPDKYLFLSALQADNRIVNYFFRLFPFSVLFQASACFLHNLFQYQFVSLNCLRSSPRPISIGQLNALLRLHPRPIYLVVFKGSY